MAKRTPIPDEVAARILFEHDRTCCVCRRRGKPVQIHHLDEDPSNHRFENLTVLCFDCHRETQIRGGFDRKLDREQLVLYRRDWCRVVKQERALAEAARESTEADVRPNIELMTSVAEIYRENTEFELLAMHYEALGNPELRDKYVDLALQKDTSDQSIRYLRLLQKRPDLIPPEVTERELTRYSHDRDWTQRARFLHGLGRMRESAEDYVRGILESLQEGNLFAAAYYLKEVHELGLTRELFILAMNKAKENGDLWWQVRALQELGWAKELQAFLIRHQAEIEASGNPLLLVLLAESRGDKKTSIELRKAIARGTRLVTGGAIIPENPPGTDEESSA